MRTSRLIRIGTRSSPMALAQVERVRVLLAEHAPDTEVEVSPMTTSGDRWAGSLATLGGKGAFTKECDDALLASAVDLVVHCVKDVPADRPLPVGTSVAAYLPRDDVRDALVHPAGRTLDELPAGTRIGTSAVRRTAQLAMQWPHLEPVPIRGNANTRLGKLDAGEVDALLMAAAGLHRIGASERITQIIAPDVMVPAVGSGTLMLLCRDGDHDTIDAVAHLNDPQTWRETVAERTMLHILQGHCHSPIGGYAHTEPDGRLSLHGRVIAPDGKTIIDAHEWSTDPTALATSVAAGLLRQGARQLIDVAILARPLDPGAAAPELGKPATGPTSPAAGSP